MVNQMFHSGCSCALQADKPLIFSLYHLIRTPNNMLHHFKCNYQPSFNDDISLLFDLNPVSKKS